MRLLWWKRTRDELFMGIPIEYVKVYAETLDQAGRAVRMQVQAPPLLLPILDRSLYVLQGRLEGIALIWYIKSGNTDESDEQLRDAAQTWLERSAQDV